MKKFLYSFAIVFVMLLSSLMLTACGEKDILSISVVEGSVNTRVLVNENIDYTNFKLKVNYEDGTSEEISKNDEMEFSSVNKTLIDVEQTVTVSYKEQSASFKVVFVTNEFDTYTVKSFNKPSFYSTYEGYIIGIDDVASTELDESDASLVKVNENAYTYKVGDDNPFKFLPIVRAKTDSGSYITLGQYTSEVKVELKNGNEYTELTGDNLLAHVDVDNENSTFQFKQVGKTYKITVKPAYYDFAPISFTVEVVDGYNAYTVRDLSIIDNNAGTAADWNTLKTAWAAEDNKSYTQDIDAIVLHNDITVTKDDVPASFFFTSGTTESGKDLTGTLINKKTFYTRDIAATDTFSIYGNYFTINTSSIPHTVEPDSQYGHSAVISFGGDNDGHPETPQGKAYVESLRMIGNASRAAEMEGMTEAEQEAELAKRIGGMTGYITNACEVTFENCSTRAYVTHLIALEGAGNICKIQNTKMIDSFSTMIFTWASKNNIIENSILKDAGGPLLISTHRENEENYQNELYSNITVINSKLISESSGTEPWFKINEAADIAAVLQAIDIPMKSMADMLLAQKLIPNSKSYVKNGAMNFIGVVLGSDNPLATLTSLTHIKGSVVIKSDANTVVSQQVLMPEAGNAYYDRLIGSEYALAQYYVLQSNNVFIAADIDMEKGTCILNLINANGSKTTIDQAALANTDLLADLVKFFDGKYIHVYLGAGGIGATLEYYNA